MKKFPSSLWVKLCELKVYRKEMTAYEKKFVNKLLKFGDPYHLSDELSVNQKEFINTLHERFVEED